MIVRHCSHCGCVLFVGENNHQDWCPANRERDDWQDSADQRLTDQLHEPVEKKP